MPKVTREIEVRNKLGLHLRAAASIVNLTNKFRSSIFLVYNGVRVNAKSIMNIAMLAAGIGTTLTAEADGDDAEEAVDALAVLFADKFGEE